MFLKYPESQSSLHELLRCRKKPLRHSIQPIGSSELHDKQVEKHFLQMLPDPYVLSGQSETHLDSSWKRNKLEEQEVQLFRPDPLHSKQEKSQSLQLWPML